ncbi:MAG: hypothetical protein FWE14_02485 [Lachnospiraceae bacterium]|nr:hypothetical protein [Lachnospiraceae bacterium]
MKEFKPKIASVIFCYDGQDEDFNLFLKSVVHDYLNTAEELIIIGTDRGVMLQKDSLDL